MAEFIYKSTIYGPQTFTVADEGGIVEFKGKQLTALGGYMHPGERYPLKANAKTLPEAARRWWKNRTQHLDSFGHKANGVAP